MIKGGETRLANFLSEEESGFFNAEEIELEDGTKSWDRVYDSEQFCEYFSLFVGNGVFINPDNQLLVSEVSGQVSRSVSVNVGWAFINGMFYHNKEIGVLDVPQNITSTVRKDGVFCRYSKADRSINVRIVEGRIEPKRLEYDYELLLAIIEVGPGVTTITNANITDTRPNESVCGFVKGLVDVIQTEQLFQQFTSQFSEWFLNLKQQFGEDAVGVISGKLSDLEQNSATKEEVGESVDYLQGQITGLVNGKVDKTDYNKLNETVSSLIESKSDRIKIYRSTLLSTEWQGTENPYTQKVTGLEGVTNESLVEISLSDSATSEQVREWGHSNISGGTQGNGEITLNLWGLKPTINIPIIIVNHENPVY